VEQWLADAVRARYDQLCWTDYPGFVDWLDTVQKSGAITPQELTDLSIAYRDPQPNRPAERPEEEGAIAYLRDPPDPGPLANFRYHGWVTDELANQYRLGDDELAFRVGQKDKDVARDIQENALHVLGRSNNPRDWGENRRGLVYGMVQSGKTANMISLVALARRAGYRLFIVLAGNKSSLRNQTQRRFNRAFELNNGLNTSLKIHSPTYNSDIAGTSSDYSGSFRYHHRFSRREEWTTIIVVKKQTDNLHALIDQIDALKRAMQRAGLDFETHFPAMILDDEADFAGQNTDVGGAGNPIHNDICALRDAITRNTYVGYTATPQACLSADINDPIGYPRDFFWLLEPLQVLENGVYHPKSYLGAYEVFWQYDDWLLQTIDRNEWPHHEKDRRGLELGVYVPPTPPSTVGTFAEGVPPDRVEYDFLNSVLRGQRPDLESLTDALIDFMIGCGVKWWREWKKQAGGDPPDLDIIERHYPYHSAIVHLSVINENQELIRNLVQKQWADAVNARRAFDIVASPPDHPFRQRWNRQIDAMRFFSPEVIPPYGEVSVFIDMCIELVEKPIFNHREEPYRHFSGNPFVYLINSTEEGADLDYDPDSADEVKTKKAAIVVGGNILSRGLTIEGLAVSYFGRTAAMSMGDTTLQMGRWFGHHLANIDTVLVYLQDGVRDILKQVAEADRYLRLQIKDAIFARNSPTEVLLEMRNSPFFRATSPAKSAFLAYERGGSGFTGQLAILKQPLFDTDEILWNRSQLEAFRDNHRWESVHNRAQIARGVPTSHVIELFDSMHCAEDASQASFKRFADYLRDWSRAAERGPLPQINVAIWDKMLRRRREFEKDRPKTADEARKVATSRFGPIVGGPSEDGITYRGDAFLDRDEPWHRTAPPNPSRVRHQGEDLLVVLYRLDPNYLTKKLWDDSGVTADSPLGRWRDEEVRLRSGDYGHIGRNGLSDEDLSVISFAAWTPEGGPMYGVGTNELIDVTKIKQRGREQLGEGDAEE
jgi:hypothetical protein